MMDAEEDIFGPGHSGSGYDGGPYGGPYSGPYSGMRGLSGNGGPSPIRGLTGGPGLWSPAVYPLPAYSGRSSSPYNMAYKPDHGFNNYPVNEGSRNAPISMNPLPWNEIAALTGSNVGSLGSTTNNGSSGLFDISAFPLSGLAGGDTGYPLVGGPSSLGFFPLIPRASSPSSSNAVNGHLHSAASTAHGQILPSTLQSPSALGAPGFPSSSHHAASFPGLTGHGIGGLPSSFPVALGFPGAPAVPGSPAAVGGTNGSPSDATSLADLQKAHPGLQPEQYKYLQQRYAYLKQPLIKSYVDSFRDPEDSPKSSSGSSSSSDASKDGNRPWNRNLRLFPNMDMSRLQLPRVREIFRNIRTGLRSSPPTSTTTEASIELFNV